MTVCLLIIGLTTDELNEGMKIYLHWVCAFDYKSGEFHVDLTNGMLVSVVVIS